MSDTSKLITFNSKADKTELSAAAVTQKVNELIMTLENRRATKALALSRHRVTLKNFYFKYINLYLHIPKSLTEFI